MSDEESIINSLLYYFPWYIKLFFSYKTYIMMVGNHTYAHISKVDSIKFTKLVHIWIVGMSFVDLYLVLPMHVKGLLNSSHVWMNP